MSLLDFFKRNGSARLAPSYTNVHSAGFAFEVNGRPVNLWVATAPNGKTEYFVMDHELCWNRMCMIGNNHMQFRPNPNEFVYDDVDLSDVFAPAKDVKKAWLFYTLVSSEKFYTVLTTQKVIIKG